MSTLIANTLQGINTVKYDANTTAMTIDSSGNAAFNQRDTKPYQISYCVQGTSAQNYSSNGTLDRIAPSPNSSTNGFHNIGGHFDASNGRFTAPIAGRYLIHCSFTAWFTGGGENDGWQQRLFVNGSSVHDFYHAGAANGYEVRSNGTVLLDLSASDYVNFQMLGFGGGASVQHHIFYGYHLG